MSHAKLEGELTHDEWLALSDEERVKRIADITIEPSTHVLKRVPLVCEKCGSGPQVDGESIYRTGETGAGVNPHWRCQKDLDSPLQVDPDVAKVVAVLEVGKTTIH